MHGLIFFLSGRKGVTGMALSDLRSRVLGVTDAAPRSSDAAPRIPDAAPRRWTHTSINTSVVASQTGDNFVALTALMDTVAEICESCPPGGVAKELVQGLYQQSKGVGALEIGCRW